MNLPRRRNRPEAGGAGAGELALLLPDDVVRKIDAVGADVDVARPLHHRAHIPRALSAKTARGDPASAKAAARRRPRSTGGGSLTATVSTRTIRVSHRSTFLLPVVYP